MNQSDRICAEEYVVKRGDSFYLIAHKLGVPLRDLLAANSNIHPARLMVGDVLCVPREEDDSPQTGGLGSGTATPPSNGSISGSTGGANGGTVGGTTNGTTNGTAGGTTNGTIPETPGGTVTEGSGGISPDTTLPCPETEQYTVEQGQTVADLQLRGLVSRHTLESANPNVDLDNLTAGQTLCVPAENVPCALPETYTLATGETLESVAVRFNLPVAALLRQNPCLAPQDFEAGVSIILPR